MPSIYSLFTAALLAGAALASPVPNKVVGRSPTPTPPGIPSAASAKTLLTKLTVAAAGSQDGYSRDEFKTWDSWGDGCDTREMVLKRDGTNVVVDSACSATSGTWKSPYDGATWTDKSDVDIDHMVPLSNAWKSGASEWTAAQRETFANDLDSPQLWAVTDNVSFHLPSGVGI